MVNTCPGRVTGTTNSPTAETVSLPLDSYRWSPVDPGGVVRSGRGGSKDAVWSWEGVCGPNLLASSRRFGG